MRDKFLRAGLTVPSTLPDASALVAGGDHFAREVFAQAGEAFGLGVVTILNTLDPGLLILSGPTEIIDVGNQVASATAFTTAAQRTLKNHAFSTSRTHTRVQNKLLTGVYASPGASARHAPPPGVRADPERPEGGRGRCSDPAACGSPGA